MLRIVLQTLAVGLCLVWFQALFDLMITWIESVGVSQARVLEYWIMWALPQALISAWWGLTVTRPWVQEARSIASKDAPARVALV